MCAEEFVRDDEFMVILGDNIVTEDLTSFVKDLKQKKKHSVPKFLLPSRIIQSFTESLNLRKIKSPGWWKSERTVF